jgi:hypothetical protein
MRLAEPVRRRERKVFAAAFFPQDEFGVCHTASFLA